ncbi:MAG: TolC family protein, partial [Candidatus Angelobacter sp.]
MFQVSLVLSFCLLPELLFGQAKISMGYSPVAQSHTTSQPATLAIQAKSTPPGIPQNSAKTRITLDEAISLALANNPSLSATRTQIQQSQAQEITANLRPNPALSFDSQFIPIFNPGSFSSDTLNNLQQFDIGMGYLFERGHKRQNRLEAARDQTSVTAAQVADAERFLIFNVGQQFINALLASSNLQFALENLKGFQETVNISEQRYKAGDISEGDYLKIKLQ